jgi:hypothetical protein
MQYIVSSKQYHEILSSRHILAAFCRKEIALTLALPSYTKTTPKSPPPYQNSQLGKNQETPTKFS